MLNPHIFRAYDVRGRIGDDVNPGVFRQVGRAYATLIRRNGGRTVAVGQDNRESSAGLKAGFIEGVRAAGVDVVDIGVVTTPMSTTSMPAARTPSMKPAFSPAEDSRLS